MIALYRGTSPTSRLIRAFTWSPYSHASWVSSDLSREIESWRKGVTAGAFGANHTPGTVVDLYEVEGEVDAVSANVEGHMGSALGCGYDLHGVLHFVSRRPERPLDQWRWFCSELVFWAYERSGLPLLARVPRWKVSPGLLSYSPLLRFVETVTVNPLVRKAA